MKCLECNVEMKVVHENHKYSESGLDNVVIVKAAKHKCPECGEESLDLPNPEALHRVLSEAIIRSNKDLNGKEFRFLRQYLGFSGAYFAKAVGVTRETISRYENGKSKIPRLVDMLIRSLVMTKIPSRDYDYHNLILEHDQKGARQQYRISAAKSGWKRELVHAD